MKTSILPSLALLLLCLLLHFGLINSIPSIKRDSTLNNMLSSEKVRRHRDLTIEDEFSLSQREPPLSMQDPSLTTDLGDIKEIIENEGIDGELDGDEEYDIIGEYDDLDDVSDTVPENNNSGEKDVDQDGKPPNEEEIDGDKNNDNNQDEDKYDNKTRPEADEGSIRQCHVMGECEPCTVSEKDEEYCQFGSKQSILCEWHSPTTNESLVDHFINFQACPRIKSVELFKFFKFQLFNILLALITCTFFVYRRRKLTAEGYKRLARRIGGEL